MKNFQQLFKELQALGVDVKYSASDAQIEQIKFCLEPDLKEQSLYLEILLTEKIQDIHFYQFFVSMPWDLNIEKQTEMATLLHQINATIPLPGFGLNIEKQWVYFRYLMPISEHAILLQQISLVHAVVLKHFEKISSANQNIH